MSGKNFLPLIIICVGLTAIFILWNFFYVPLQSEILQMKTETKKFQALAQDLKTLQNRHENFSDFVEANADKLNDLEKFLPSAPSQEKFTAAIYKSAEKNKLVVTSLQIGELIALDEKNLSHQSVKIKIEGNYIAILNFIREIEDGERFAKPENISLAVESGNLILCEAEFFIFNRD